MNKKLLIKEEPTAVATKIVTNEEELIIDTITTDPITKQAIIDSLEQIRNPQEKGATNEEEFWGDLL